MLTTFVGQYVNDMRLVLSASLVAQEHCMLLGAPGWGKTDIAESAARNAVGLDKRVFIRFAPSTPPQRVEGMFDPSQAIANPPRFVLVRDDTAFDPNAKILVLDEFGRASDIVFDIVLDATDRRDIPSDQVPVVWGTSNFAPTSARTEALRDRFALWHWIHPGSPDVSAIIMAHAQNLHRPLEIGDMPTWKQVEEIRNADPGEHAIKICDEILTLLSQEAAKAGLNPNPRRVKQWFRLLYRTNVLLHGTADFNFSHAQASKVLTWAWANTDEGKASDWSKIAGCVVDIIGTAINELKSRTLEQVKNMMQRTKNEPRSKLAIALGEIVADGKREIESLGIQDARIQAALDEIEAVFVQVTQGKNPFESD
jgi:MoxR-like ATPase